MNPRGGCHRLEHRLTDTVADNNNNNGGPCIILPKCYFFFSPPQIPGPGASGETAAVPDRLAIARRRGFTPAFTGAAAHTLSLTSASKHDEREKKTKKKKL